MLSLDFLAEGFSMAKEVCLIHSSHPGVEILGRLRVLKVHLEVQHGAASGEHAVNHELKNLVVSIMFRALNVEAAFSAQRPDVFSTEGIPTSFQRCLVDHFYIRKAKVPHDVF